MKKALLMAGLLGLTGLAVGCTERQESGLREDGRQVGQEVEDSADAVEGAGQEATEDLREGTGGAGNEDLDVGENEGVLNDGEGPFEQNDVQGEDNVLREGQGPIEERQER